MSGSEIAGIVRAVAAALGGYFVAKGTIDQETMVQVSGAVAVLASAVWSILSKRITKVP